MDAKRPETMLFCGPYGLDLVAFLDTLYPEILGNE